MNKAPCVCSFFNIKLNKTCAHTRKQWVNLLCNSCCLLSLSRGRFWLIAICCSEKDEACLQRNALCGSSQGKYSRKKMIFSWPESTESSLSSGADHLLKKVKKDVMLHVFQCKATHVMMLMTNDGWCGLSLNIAFEVPLSNVFDLVGLMKHTVWSIFLMSITTPCQSLQL